MSLSSYLENALADHVCGGSTFTQPSNIYVKLHLGDPGEDGTANAAVETTREAVTFGAASGGVATSNADVTWTSVSTTETYSHVSLWDASTAGNCLGSGALSSSVGVTAGDNFTIASGDLTFTLD
jgi:hypothetical protein